MAGTNDLFLNLSNCKSNDFLSSYNQLINRQLKFVHIYRAVLFLFHLVFAAFFAMDFFRLAESFFARAFPPLLAPILPRATAAALRVSGIGLTGAGPCGPSVVWITCDKARDAAACTSSMSFAALVGLGIGQTCQAFPGKQDDSSRAKTKMRHHLGLGSVLISMFQMMKQKEDH
jgi:hypothetical protein